MPYTKEQLKKMTPEEIIKLFFREVGYQDTINMIRQETYNFKKSKN